ncbi:LysR family transcriptional regulator [Vibrio sp. 10N.286.49.B3]|uniref:LysR family transcriptional regulator n=1 Tax=Vibrio sp. 10N.286.49.B3 TaxID=1880855 RepID=UPI000C81FF59|nr:LysR family transcriptional regulator [Vibrio sp. 10N.286.49.B3]PMH44517.1 LysR family transcriptional regulator [Vibrio sp. 10N.286.49.B3]
MLNNAWLKTFKTLVEIGHFTQTAEKLYMTQPGVSQHIKKLELSCGYSLIIRSGKSFELTEQGRLVYDYALKVANNEAGLLERLSFDNPKAGVCKLATSGALALLLYPKLISLQYESPQLITYFEVAPNHKILNDIQLGSIDLGIVTHVPNPSLFQAEEIGQEPLCMIFPKAYQGQVIDIDALKACGMIKHPDAEHYLSLYLEKCGDAELKNINPADLPAKSYINQLTQILVPIAQGIGFTVLPQSAVEAFALKDQLFVYTPQKAVLETLYLVSKRHRQLPKRYETVSQTIKNSLEVIIN